MRRFRERIFGASSASGDEANAPSSESKYGRYQRSPELERIHGICRHLEQMHLPQVKIAIRALKDQAKAAELAATAATVLSDTVAFIDDHPFESGLVTQEGSVDTASERPTKDSEVNGDQDDTASIDLLNEEKSAVEQLESDGPNSELDATRNNQLIDNDGEAISKSAEEFGAVTGNKDDEEESNQDSQTEQKVGVEVEVEMEVEAETNANAVDQEDQSVQEEIEKGSILGDSQKLTKSRFLEVVEDLVEAYTIEVPRLEKWMQDLKATRLKVTASERLEKQAMSYRKQLHDSQERRISAKSGREALPPTPADLAADEKLRVLSEDTAEAAKNATLDAEEQLETLQEGGDIKDAAKVAICRAGRCYAAFAEVAITYAGSKAESEAIKSQMAALAGLR